MFIYIFNIINIIEITILDFCLKFIFKIKNIIKNRASCETKKIFLKNLINDVIICVKVLIRDFYFSESFYQIPCEKFFINKNILVFKKILYFFEIILIELIKIFLIWMKKLNLFF